MSVNADTNEDLQAKAKNRSAIAQETGIDVNRLVSQGYTSQQAINFQIDQMNRMQQIKREEYRANKEADAATKQAAERNAIKQQLFKDSPHLLKYFQDKKDKIQQSSDYMLTKAKEFYSLEDEDIRTYTTLPHQPEASAVKYLLGTYVDDRKRTVYQCLYCEQEFSSLKLFEWHCYTNEQAGHRSRLLQMIEDQARQDIANIDRELESDIDNAIQAKHNAAARIHIAKQKAEEAKTKSRLPFVVK